ncbi:N-methyl-L-tryptophan oxidase [bacterium]|nr:N-methyl-L-tryptophan oxidase [bacterium]
MNATSRHYDVIVVGVGGMGSAAVYNLAKRNKRVLGLEKYDIPHDMGSSHGYTRIIRLAYYEHPSYVMLLHRAYQLWEELEAVSGEHLLHITGSIDAGPADSWVFKGSFQSCVEYELPHEVLTGKELMQRFPGYRLPFDHMALLQPRGGFLTPERCTVAYVEAAHALGAEIHAREEVLRWAPEGDGVRVFTTRDSYTADRLVITAGAWNNQMVPLLRGLAVPERQVLAWFQPRKPEFFRPDNFPVFNLLVDEGRYYGFPVHGVPGFKIGKYHHFLERDDAERLDHESHDADEWMLREFTDRYFPDAAGPTMSLQSCMFTNSPDGHFIIDLYPGYPQVSFAAGFTGHGYKFASVVGEIMGDLAINGRTRHDIELFRHDRFHGDGSLRPYIDRSHDHLRDRRVEEIFRPLDGEVRFRQRFTGRRGGEAMRRRSADASMRRGREGFAMDPAEFLHNPQKTSPFW